MSLFIVPLYRLHTDTHQDDRNKAKNLIVTFACLLETGKEGWDDQMRGIQTIDQDHVRPGNGGRRWDEMIR